MGLFWQKAGFCTGPRLYVVVFAVDDVLFTGRLSSLTVYWCEHWPRRLLRTEWWWIMIQSGNVQYTYTKRFDCFFRSQCFWWRGAFLPSQFILLSQLLLSQVHFCRVSCWVSYLLTRRIIAESVLPSQTDSLLMWTLTALLRDRVTLSHDSERKRTMYVY